MSYQELASKLVCPYCHELLLAVKNKILCEYCKQVFPVRNDIPIFFSKIKVDSYTSKEYNFWNDKVHAPESLYERLTTRAFQELLDSFSIANNSRGIEMGCGDGPFARRLKNKKLEIFGLDVSFPLLTLTENMTPIQGNAQKLPFKDAYFDWLIYGFSLHHMPDTKIALKEACRVLKSSAKIFIVEPNYYHPIRFLTRKPGLYIRRCFFSYLTPEEKWLSVAKVNRILRSQNINIESIRFISPEFRSNTMASKLHRFADFFLNFPPLNIFLQSYYIIIGNKSR